MGRPGDNGHRRRRAAWCACALEEDGLDGERRGRGPTYLVVNGDDFGYSDPINEAVVRCHAEGLLTSATLLVNRPATGAALRLAASRPALGLGLHLNLTEGAPVSPPADVPSLVGADGRFRPFPGQLRRIAGGGARRDELERELRAQFELFVARGRVPTHVDGHLHVHAYPRVLPLVLRLMGEYGVRAMRSPILAAWLPARRAQRVARAEARRLSGQPVVVADRLLDCARFLRLADPVAGLAEAVASVEGVVELMAHPAWNRGERRGAAEVALLTDPRLRAALDRRGVRLVHYGELAELL